MMSAKWVGILVLLAILVIFTVQNYEVVTIQFLLWSFRTSRAIVIFGTLVIGAVIGWIGSYMARENR